MRFPLVSLDLLALLMKDGGEKSNQNNPRTMLRCNIKILTISIRKSAKIGQANETMEKYWWRDVGFTSP